MTPRVPAAHHTAGQALISSTTMLMIGVGRIAQRRMEAALSEHGLALRHVGALGHLAHTPELSYSDLARRAHVTAQSMHATIANLVALDAIGINDAGPGRAAQLHLTPHGQRLLITAAAIAQQIDTTWNIGDDDTGAEEFTATLSRTLTSNRPTQ